MTFKLDLEPPKGGRGDPNLRTWLTRLWDLLHGWFNKLYDLGTGIVLDSSDRLSVDATVIPSIPVPLGDIQDITSDRLLGRDTAGTGEIEQLTVGGGIEFTGAGGIQTSAFTGDVTKSAGGTAQTIANDAVTFAKMQEIAGLSVIGRGDNVLAGNPQEITGGVDQVLRVNSIGTALAFGTTATGGIANDAVTFAKMQNLTAARLLGRGSASSGDPEELTAVQGVRISGTELLGPRRYSNTSVPAGNTVANTVTETTLSSTYSIPADTLAAGTVIRIHLRGLYSSDVVAPTLRIRIKLDGDTIIDTTAITLIGGITAGAWVAHADLHVWSLGGSGLLDAQGDIQFSTALTTALTTLIDNSSTFTIDTTGALPITVTVEWGTADTDNTITLRQMSVEIL